MIVWNKVTWYSKLLALVVFVGVIVLTFYIGAQYGEVAKISSEIPVVVSSTTTVPKTPASPTSVPVQTKKGTLAITVLLGPVCPVESVPPNPACAPKPFSTTVRIQPNGQSAYHATISSTDSSGSLSISLIPGTYTVQPHYETSDLPRCTSQQVKIVAGQTVRLSFTCDTGIR